MSPTDAKTLSATRTEALHDEYAKSIYGYCLHRLASREEAEDAAQIVFLNAQRSLQQGTNPRSEGAWLFKIAEHVVLNRWRSQHRRARVEFPVDLAAIAEVTPDAHLEAASPSGNSLAAALARIPDTQRRALMLRELEGLSHGEVAKIMDISTAAAGTLLVRARRSLARELSDAAPGSRKRVPLGLCCSLPVKWLSGGGVAVKALAGAASVVVLAGAVAATPIATEPRAPRGPQAARHISAAPRVARTRDSAPARRGRSAPSRTAVAAATRGAPRPATSTGPPVELVDQRAAEYDPAILELDAQKPTPEVSTIVANEEIPARTVVASGDSGDVPAEAFEARPLAGDAHPRATGRRETKTTAANAAAPDAPLATELVPAAEGAKAAVSRASTHSDPPAEQPVQANPAPQADDGLSVRDAAAARDRGAPRPIVGSR